MHYRILKRENYSQQRPDIVPLQFKVKCNAALLFIFTVLQLGHNGTTKVFKVLFLNVDLLFNFSNNYEKIAELKVFF